MRECKRQLARKYSNIIKLMYEENKYIKISVQIDQYPPLLICFEFSLQLELYSQQLMA